MTPSLEGRSGLRVRHKESEYWLRRVITAAPQAGQSVGLANPVVCSELLAIH